MSDIANRLDISPPLVVYHFGSKDALLAEAFAYASRTEIEDLDAIAESDDSPVSRLDALLVAGVGPSTARVVGDVDRLVGRSAAFARAPQDLASARRPLASGARERRPTTGWSRAPSVRATLPRTRP